MKKLSILFLSVICIFALASCNDFLDMRSTNSIDTDGSITTVTDADVAINGLVREMLSASLYGKNVFLYADAKGGDFAVVSSGRGNDVLYTFEHSASSGSYSDYWNVGFKCITQINDVLSSIAKVEAGGSLEDFSYEKGQLYTYRAMIYYDLVRMYGKDYAYDKSALAVPLVTEALASDAKPSRATVEEIYTQIVSDLTTGAGLIGKTMKNGFANYWSNRAIMARVDMSMQQYADALKICQEIIASKKFSLYSNDDWVSSWSKQFGSESILELTVNDTEADLVKSSLGITTARKGDYSKMAPGYFVASDFWLKRMKEDPTDIRWGVMSYDEISKTRMGACYKYLGGVTMKGDGKASGTAVNIKLIRLSEIYLIAAEAAFRTGNKSAANGAAYYLNQIRKRSPLLNKTPIDETTVTLDLILSEKSKELFGEGQRYWDMIRCNQTIFYNDDIEGGEGKLSHPGRPTYVNPVTKEEYSSIDRTYPKAILPISEGNIITDGNLVQNPGY